MDIEIIAPTDFQILVIQGTNSIQVPTTGQHQEHFSTFLNAPAQKTSKEVSAVWSLKEPYDHMITLDKNGNLTIPAGVQGDRLTLAVTYASATPVYSVSDEFEVVLENGRSSPEKQIAKTIQTDQNKVEYSAYNRFSKAFDAWAYENRPLFVIIIISALFILLVVLAFFQHRLN